MGASGLKDIHRGNGEWCLLESERRGGVVLRVQLRIHLGKVEGVIFHLSFLIFHSVI